MLCTPSSLPGGRFFDASSVDFQKEMTIGVFFFEKQTITAKAQETFIQRLSDEDRSARQSFHRDPEPQAMHCCLPEEQASHLQKEFSQP